MAAEKLSDIMSPAQSLFCSSIYDDDNMHAGVQHSRDIGAQFESDRFALILNHGKCKENI